MFKSLFRKMSELVRGTPEQQRARAFRKQGGHLVRSRKTIGGQPHRRQSGAPTISFLPIDVVAIHGPKDGISVDRVKAAVDSGILKVNKRAGMPDTSVPHFVG